MDRTRLHFAADLRRELCSRNAFYAKSQELPHSISYGESGVVVYKPDPEGRHGNFLDTTYRAILRKPEWRRRLVKVHSQGRKSLPPSDAIWRELDSSMSSDALLMNISCHPGALRAGALRSMLGVDAGISPEFGFRARVPFASGRADRTEVDMKFGHVLVEAKLTESDFQMGPERLVESYRDLGGVFAVRELPKVDGSYASYQLIRNVLAAHNLGHDFCVILDQRRPDLSQAWYEIMGCITDVTLRTRCKVLTWQELSVALPDGLRKFLDRKYGIAAPGSVASTLTEDLAGH
jgi:hypothetical protein